MTTIALRRRQTLAPLHADALARFGVSVSVVSALCLLCTAALYVAIMVHIAAQGAQLRAAQERLAHAREAHKAALMAEAQARSVAIATTVATPPVQKTYASQ